METYINKSPYKLGQFGEQLATMTEQEVFNIAAEHLILQNKKSELAEGVCDYDGGDVCCAAAPFIRNYKSSMEEKEWSSHNVNPENLHGELIGDLQRVHDDNHVEGWKYNLITLANYHNLELPEILKGEPNE